MRARRQYLDASLGRYLRSRKRHKGAILDEYRRSTGQNRKDAIRKIAQAARGRVGFGKRGRPATDGRWGEPFASGSFHSDNDNAFINDQLYLYTQEKGPGFTCSRPCLKNDNAHSEQKNFTHVRKPLGYLQYDTPEELEVIQSLNTIL